MTGMSALRTIAIATPTEARRVNMVLPLNDEKEEVPGFPNLPPALESQ
jgi:hypothetical protein